MFLTVDVVDDVPTTTRQPFRDFHVSDEPRRVGCSYNINKSSVWLDASSGLQQTPGIALAASF